MELDEVLRTVADRVPYLRASVAVDGDDWIGCDALVADPTVLTRVVRSTKSGFETDDDAVAASLFAQAYAFRVAGIALAAYALDLPVPDVASAATAVKIDKPRPSAVAYLRAEVAPASAERLAAELVGAHLRAFVEAVHEEFRVGERLLWGNVASSCATAFRAVESSGADRAPTRARADEFFAASAQWFDGLGRFTVVEHDGREGWYWDRTNCCLWYRTERGTLCDNCSLIDTADLFGRRRRELAEKTEPNS